MVYEGAEWGREREAEGRDPSAQETELGAEPGAPMPPCAPLSHGRSSVSAALCLPRCGDAGLLKELSSLASVAGEGGDLCPLPEGRSVGEGLNYTGH